MRATVSQKMLSLHTPATSTHPGWNACFIVGCLLMERLGVRSTLLHIRYSLAREHAAREQCKLQTTDNCTKSTPTLPSRPSALFVCIEKAATAAATSKQAHICIYMHTPSTAFWMAVNFTQSASLLCDSNHIHSKRPCKQGL